MKISDIKAIVKDLKIETPKPNQLYYNLYFAAGLLRYPFRAWNLLKLKLSKFSEAVNYYPTVIDLEPTQKCNYGCVMCIIPNMKEKRPSMTFETFKKIVDEQYGLMEVKIQGVGEPLLNKDFFKMVDYAKMRLLWVRTTINGSLLHVNDNYKKLVDSKIHDINISIDGCTKDVYESIRIGGNFEQIVVNSKLVNDYNNTTHKTTIRGWVVLQHKNKHQFVDFPKFFADLDFKEMALSFAMHNYGREGENIEATEFEYTKEQFEKVVENAKEAGIKINFWFHPHFMGSAFCQIPFNRFYLTTDCHILPCCYIANQDVVDFGLYDDFKKIWFEDYKAFRKGMKERGNAPSFCKNCYSEVTE